MSQRVLVTGGLGFIGSHLTRELLRDPDIEVTVVDDLSGTVFDPMGIVDWIIADRPGSLDFHLVTVDEFFELRSPGSLDTIYHLASVVGPAAVLKSAGYITESIVHDTYLAIGMATRCGARLVNVSTSEIYGGGVDGYCHEDTPRVIRGRSSARQEYAAAKLASEVALENLCRAGRLDAVTIRPFNVAGVRQSGRGGFVLPRFVGQAILGEPLTVFGDGRQVRAFTDARDIASGMILCAERGESGRAYNVGNPGNRIAIGELADRVLTLTGSTSEKQFVDPHTIHGPAFAEAADKFPDAARIMELGWKPLYGLDDTIRAVFESMRSLPEGSLCMLAGLPWINQPIGNFTVSRT